MGRALTLTPLTGIPYVQAGDDIAELIYAALVRAGIELRSGDILVLAQKIVSKAEGRRIHLETVSAGSLAEEIAQQTEKDPRLVELILQESRCVLRKRPGLIIVEHRLGFVCANAGIDHSNVEGDDDWVLLLPIDPDGSAAKLRAELQARSQANLGVLIIDSHGRAWRQGTLGLTIGLSGLPAVQDARGIPDLFGRILQVTEIGVADELAAAASLVMGQAAEGVPVVHVRGFPYPLREAGLAELIRPEEKDMFR